MKVNIPRYNKGNSERKISVEINNFDTYSLDHTLAYIILPALLQLKDTKQGIPSDFANVGGEDFTQQTCFDFYRESNDWAFNKRVEQWNEVLDKMIWSFQQILIDDYHSKYHHGNPEYDFLESDKQYPNPVTGKLEKTYRMVNTNPGDHWYDFVGHQLHEEKIQEGLDLFGKYFRALWD